MVLFKINSLSSALAAKDNFSSKNFYSKYSAGKFGSNFNPSSKRTEIIYPN